MLNNIFIITICSLFLTIKGVSQSDTAVDLIKYNHIKYYDNKKINELGNYKVSGTTKIKNGAWIIYDQNSNVIEKGTYHNNKKSGYWLEKEPDNNDIWQGNYLHNKRNGEWYCENRKKIYKHGKEKCLIIASYN
jgi:antitoxin component YwqK of YwqJK toxin-antitoxin module